MKDPVEWAGAMVLGLIDLGMFSVALLIVLVQLG
jgi:hypothetical protein